MKPTSDISNLIPDTEAVPNLAQLLVFDIKLDIFWCSGDTSALSSSIIAQFVYVSAVFACRLPGNAILCPVIDYLVSGRFIAGNFAHCFT